MYFNKWLKLTIGFTFLLVIIRIAVSNSLNYIFLPWNLLLAFIPLWISNKKLQVPNYSQTIFNIDKRLYALFWFSIWLLFLPNAPYIITDLLHLKARNPIPFYFDIVLLFMSAMCGLVFFFVTVQQVEKWWQYNLPKWSINWFYSLAFGLCSFGIYLGRYGRFNSWNILTKPQLLLQEVGERIIFPFEHPRTWAVTLLFSIMLFLFYQVAKNWNQINQNISETKNHYKQ
jgi:uncharacterized membrane protein